MTQQSPRELTYKEVEQAIDNYTASDTERADRFAMEKAGTDSSAMLEVRKFVRDKVEQCFPTAHKNCRVLFYPAGYGGEGDAPVMDIQIYAPTGTVSKEAMKAFDQSIQPLLGKPQESQIHIMLEGDKRLYMSLYKKAGLGLPQNDERLLMTDTDRISGRVCYFTPEEMQANLRQYIREWRQDYTESRSKPGRQ